LVGKWNHLPGVGAGCKFDLEVGQPDTLSFFVALPWDSL
jgi:hypothetical protein